MGTSKKKHQATLQLTSFCLKSKKHVFLKIVTIKTAIIIIIIIIKRMQMNWVQQQPMAAHGGLSMMFIEWESSVYSVVWLEYQNPSLRVNAAAFWLTGWALLEEPRGRGSTLTENTGSAVL